MPTYAYKARDPMGKRVAGAMEAPTQAELTDKLHKLGYIVTQIHEGLPGIRMESVFDLFRRIHTEDMVMFNVQLSNLLHAGVPLLSSLTTLSEQIESKNLKEVVKSVSRSVEGGESFSDALLHHPRVFPSLFVNMVRVGEASGRLDTVLSRYARYCEEQAELSQKIRGAVFYPILLLFMGTAVMLFVVTTLIPQFAEIFIKAGLTLPLPTRILYSIGISIKQFWLSLILFALLGWLGAGYYAGTTTGRIRVDRFKLKLPVIGSLYRRVGISRLGRTLGMLIASGVPILESLEIAKDVVGNATLRQALDNARQAVEKGERLSEPLRISGEFPPDAVQMISVGEETGNLDEMLGKIADFYDRAVDYSVKKLTTLLEPLLLVIMGCIVGLIMASMLLPMFDMVKMLRR